MTLNVCHTIPAGRFPPVDNVAVAALNIEKLSVAFEQRHVRHMQFAPLTPHHHHRGACHRHHKKQHDESRVLIEYGAFLLVYGLPVELFLMRLIAVLYLGELVHVEQRVGIPEELVLIEQGLFLVSHFRIDTHHALVAVSEEVSLVLQLCQRVVLLQHLECPIQITLPLIALVYLRIRIYFHLSRQSETVHHRHSLVHPARLFVHFIAYSCNKTLVEAVIKEQLTARNALQFLHFLVKTLGICGVAYVASGTYHVVQELELHARIARDKAETIALLIHVESLGKVGIHRIDASHVVVCVHEIERVDAFRVFLFLYIAEQNRQSMVVVALPQISPCLLQIVRSRPSLLSAGCGKNGGKMEKECQTHIYEPSASHVAKLQKDDNI